MAVQSSLPWNAGKSEMEEAAPDLHIFFENAIALFNLIAVGASYHKLYFEID
jgi:hypothetical protein